MMYSMFVRGGGGWPSPRLPRAEKERLASTDRPSDPTLPETENSIRGLFRRKGGVPAGSSRNLKIGESTSEMKINHPDDTDANPPPHK